MYNTEEYEMSATSLTTESENKTEEVISTKVPDLKVHNLPVHLWIDIPNDFPWRNCLQEYNRALTPLHCKEVCQLKNEPVQTSFGFRIYLINNF